MAPDVQHVMASSQIDAQKHTQLVRFHRSVFITCHFRSDRELLTTATSVQGETETNVPEILSN